MRQVLSGFITLVIATGVAALAAQAPQLPPPSQTPAPTFRGGIDIVTLDVTVLDAARRPVRDLTAADFTLLENGTPQPIVAFAPVDVPDVVSTAPAWMREVAPDVASNALEQRRLIVIVMDDAGTRFDPGVSKFATTIANRVIDGLGPADLAAVAFTFQGRAQTFTSDREQLRAAVNSFAPKGGGTANMPTFANAAVGRPGGRASGAGPLVACINKTRDGGCSVDAIRHASDALKSAPPGRKLLVYISSGDLPVMTSDNPDVLDQLGPVSEMLRSLQSSNIAVYTFSAEGLTVGKDPGEDGMRMLAENTGGRAAVATNEPWQYVPEMFRENSSYYLLGFRSTARTGDARHQRLSIRVNRPGVEVRSRDGYFVPQPEKVKKSKNGPPSALDAAITKSMPTGDLPLSVATAAFAVPGRKTAELAVITGIRDDAGGSDAGPRNVKVVATAFDTAWRSKGAHTQTLAITPRADARGEVVYDVVSRLPLAPGRYEIRLAAESGARTGSVFLDLDIPDFAKAPLSLSGALVEKTPAVAVAPGSPLANIVPVTPTARRTFDSSEQVSAFVRVYQGTSVPLTSIRMTARVENDRGVAVFNQTATLDAVQFSGSRAADYRLALPLSRWPPGEYLVSLEAARGQTAAHRTIRLTVR